MVCRAVLLFVVASCVELTRGDINMDQLNGMKELLKGLDKGVFATCSIVLFSDLVDFDTADKNCTNFTIGSGMEEVGNLATVNDEVKNRDLQALLEMAYPLEQQPGNKWGPTMWVWAGLRKTNNNNSKKPGPYNPADWEWADGSHPTTYSSWLGAGTNKAQPDQASLKKG